MRLQTLYTLGAVLGQLPFAYLFTRVPMSWTIPFLDILWGVFTLLQYRVTSFSELAAYRFLVGWFEAAFFPGMHYIFGLSPLALASHRTSNRLTAGIYRSMVPWG